MAWIRYEEAKELCEPKVDRLYPYAVAGRGPAVWMDTKDDFPAVRAYYRMTYGQDIIYWYEYTASGWDVKGKHWDEW